MSYSRLEEREKRIIKNAVEKAENERDAMKDILEEIADKMDENGHVTFNKSTMQKILAITTKI